MNAENSNATALAIRESAAVPVRSIDDLKTLGEIISQSGMFGTRNPAEAIMVAAMCHQDGISYSKWMETNHMIQGRKTKRADAIHADFLRNGGQVKIIRRDMDGVEVELTKNGCTNKFGLTWADAIKEPFVYEGGESAIVAALAVNDRNRLKIKPKYQTPRSRTQMLWARVISDAVRAVDPTSCQGVYTPEEIEDVVEATATDQPPRRPVQAKRAEKIVEAIADDAPKTTPKPATKPAAVAEVVDALPVSEPVREPPRHNAEPVAVAASPTATPFDSPFDTPAAAPATAPDYSTCPIKGKLFGVPWAKMDVATLGFAANLTNPELTPKHREAIVAALETLAANATTEE
jgi:hypothetical protein